MRIGIIGAGHMGTALARGLLRAGFKAGDIMASDPDRKMLKRLGELGIKTTVDNRRTVSSSDVVFLAVRPNVVDRVLKETEKEIRDALLVSLAAGVSTDFIEKRTGARVIRAMPNMGAEVGEMASCYCLGKRATPEDEELLRSIFGAMGETFRVDEHIMNAVTGLSGSGLAYFYLVMKAMRDAGVELGLPDKVALKLAAQTAKGAGAIVLNSGKKPEELVEEVCTPGGTTAEGISVLRKKRIESAFREAVKAAAKRADELSS
ncbi:MAG: pyrroline-5-carboxylate reductase [Candidatus Hadarchaeales archaeon]